MFAERTALAFFASVTKDLGADSLCSGLNSSMEFRLLLNNKISVVLMRRRFLGSVSGTSLCRLLRCLFISFRARQTKRPSRALAF